MIIAALNERKKDSRVAIAPETLRSYKKLECSVLIEENAGQLAGFSNNSYQQQGAEIEKERSILLEKTDILLCVNEPVPEDITGLRSRSLIIAPVESTESDSFIQWCITQQISLFSMNHIPRISRAQSIDSLSSQANLAGYKAVLEATQYFQRVVPMMMTAAGMIKPAKILVLGAGVAGLQAIATAKRLGAVVYAFDVRPSAKEQVESLGAQFIEVEHQEEAESQSGYANEMSEQYKKIQQKLIHDHAKIADIIITTALIPGKKAPLLLPKTTIEQMKPGSVVIDLAASHGGNCELSENNKSINHEGILILGNSNMAGLIPATASELYANNLAHLVQMLVPEKTLFLDSKDEIIQKALLCHEGIYMPFAH